MSNDPASTVDLNYLKSPNFREVSSDGIVGGPTPNGKVWVAFFTERYPLPRIVRHALVETDVAGQFRLDDSIPAQPIDGRAGIVRNVEFGVYLSVQGAKDLRDWLNKQIDSIGGER